MQKYSPFCSLIYVIPMYKIYTIHSNQCVIYLLAKLFHPFLKRALSWFLHSQKLHSYPKPRNCIFSQHQKLLFCRRMLAPAEGRNVQLDVSKVGLKLHRTYADHKHLANKFIMGRWQLFALAAKKKIQIEKVYLIVLNIKLTSIAAVRRA